MSDRQPVPGWTREPKQLYQFADRLLKLADAIDVVLGIELSTINRLSKDLRDARMAVLVLAWIREADDE